MQHQPTTPSASEHGTDNPEATAPAESAAAPPPLIVGIGASAGGLEAFKSFLAHMPADSDMAFVLIQHLAPTHVSMLGELLSRSTTMPVLDAADGERVQPRHVYVIPPDATLTIHDGVLQLSKPAPPRQHRWPINTFFTSLAEDQGECAVCIVLSGTGSDGARGLRAIKDHGGLTLAQSGFDHVAMSGMPASAAATGLVDHILPVEEMPARLIAHQDYLRIAHGKKDGDGNRQDLGAHLQTITRMMFAQVGHDFSQYKEKTLVRRIQRRMQVVQAQTVPEYIAYLHEHPEEHERLFHEMLIGVTEFFRDPLAFTALQQQAIPALLAGKDATDTVRVWVPACATGEEAYSIAMVLGEAMGEHGSGGNPKVQIFATDIDDAAIGSARAGRFKAPLTAVSRERRERWFTREGDDYCVVKPLREMCVFSSHSAIKDPPFSRLDLISCRNLLIYLNPALQERLVRAFHYALRPDGFLLLGPSEGVSRNAALFTVVDKKHRLYVRREDSGVGEPGIAIGRPGTHADGAPRGAIATRVPGEDAIDAAARRSVEKYAPAYVVIDEAHNVLRFSGDTGRYLGPSSGAASLNLFALLDRDLRGAVRAAVHQAFATGKQVEQDGLGTLVEGPGRSLRLVVAPLPQPESTRRLCVVAFVEGAPATIGASLVGEAESARLQSLQEELDATRQQLHAAIEQQEINSEELKSANEEYQSVNEELQSSNEELETSKEEMQSINEELQTINAELHSKNDALARANSDVANLLESTQIATLFLDAQLHIRSYTPVITDLFHLRDGDRGRPITEIAARVNYPELARDVKQVLRTLGLVERVLQDIGGGPAFLMRMRPYRTVDNIIDGVVLTFVDITERRRHEMERGELAAIVESSEDAIIGHTLTGTITSWNQSAERILGYQASRVIGRSLALLVPEGIDDRALMRACEQAQPSALEMDVVRLDGSLVPMAITCSPVVDGDGHVVAGSLTARDVSRRMDSDRHIQLMMGELNHRVKNTLASVQSIALQTAASAPSVEAFQASFLPRLHALANTHNLLAEDAWKGVGLREVVVNELAPYQREEGARIIVVGEPLQLAPKVALALGMALHELATNAAKYGALSVAYGKLTVSWDTRQQDDRGWLHLRWIERNGPPTTAPSRTGFGTRLVGQGLAYELGGRVKLSFDPEGVSCAIDVPLQEDGSQP